MSGIGNGNDGFNVIKPFQFWSQHVLPLVYGDEISYMEVQDKLSFLVNELIKNNNELPEYVQKMIEEFINSPELKEIFQGILSDFMLNVKFPPKGIKPAKGDGTIIDTESIQGCIDYAAKRGYGCVYFPAGQYLTGSLEMKDNVSLFSFDRYSTSLTLANGASKPLLGGTANNISVSNLKLVGGLNQVNKITLISITGSSALFNNLILTDSNKLFEYTGVAGDIQMTDILFGKCSENAATLNGSSIGQIERLIFSNLSVITGVDVFRVGLNNSTIDFVSTTNCPMCLTLLGDYNDVKCKILNTNNTVADMGKDNNVNVIGKNVVDNVSGNVKLSYGSLIANINETLGVTAKAIIEKCDSYNLTVKNSSVNVTSEVKTVGENSSEVVAKNKTVTADKIELNSYADTIITAKKRAELNGDDVIINPTEPVTYKKPTTLSEYFNCIKFKDKANDVYDVLVNNGVNELEDVLSSKITFVETSDSMINSSSLIPGMTVMSKGYHTVNDGGSCLYLIREKLSSDVDNGYVRFIKNNLVAFPVEMESVNVKCWGAYGDNVHDDYVALQAFFNYIIGSFKTPLIPDGEYTFSKTITLSGMGGRNYNFGTAAFTYTGTDYAFVITKNKAPDLVIFGNVNARNGGCFHITSTSTNTYVQYLNLWFGGLYAKTKCIWVECVAGWCNEIRFKGGSFSGGAEYGCHLDCSKVVPPDGEINSIVFDTVGVEGVTTGFLFESADVIKSGRGTVTGVTINEPRAWESYTNFLQTINRVTSITVNSSHIINNDKLFKQIKIGASQILFNCPLYVNAGKYGGTVYDCKFPLGRRLYGKITIDALPPFAAGGSLTLNLDEYLFPEDNLTGISYIGVLSCNAGNALNSTFLFVLKKVGTSRSFSVDPVFPVVPVTEPPTTPRWAVKSSGSDIIFTCTTNTSACSLSLIPLCETSQ